MKRSRAPFAHGLMLHHGHDPAEGPSSQGSVSSEAFRELIEVHGPGRFLSPETWIRRAQEGSLRDGDLCLTFDDGLRCQYEVFLPVMEEFGLRGFWFVYTGVFEKPWPELEIYAHFRFNYFEDIGRFYEAFTEAFRSSGASPVDEEDRGAWIRRRKKNFPFYTIPDLEYRYLRDRHLEPGRYRELMDGLMAQKGADRDAIARKLWMSPEQLGDLEARGHAVGLHSHSHPTVMADLPAERQREEYQANFERLAGMLKEPPVTASHPCNSYNADTLQIWKELGIRCGFRANLKPAPSGEVNPTPLELAREDPANLR